MTPSPFILSDDHRLLDPSLLHHPQRQGVLKVMELLRSGQFAALQALLEPSWTAFEAGTLSDLGLQRAWPHLGLQRADLIEPAQAWVQAYPHSFAALVFAAQLHCVVAWQARGTATSNHTGEEQFAVMQKHFDAAFPYLHRALASAARPTIAIAVGITMTRAGSDDPEQDYIALAQPHLPRSPLLYGRLMWALNPKWGGSVEEMDALFQSAQTWSAAWPEAERKLVQATHQIELADMEACSGYFADAIAMLKGIVQDMPGFDDAHSKLASQYNLGDQMDLAVSHLLQAVRIVPSADRLSRLGDYYEELGQPETAAAYFEEAMLWGSGDAAGSMASLLSDRLQQAPADQRPALEQHIGRVAQYGMQQYSSRTMFVLGAIEFFQRGDAPAKARAYDWWRRAAQWGHGTAMLNLGLAHLEGDEGQPLDKTLGVQYLEQAAEMGMLSAHQRLGRAYLEGDGVAKDDDRGAYHLEVAAEGENLYAMRDWITCLWFGRGTEQDRDTAKQLLKRLKALSPDVHASARDRIGMGASIKNLVGKLLG